MLEGFMMLAAVAVFNSDAVTEFRENSNGNPVYKFVYVDDCETGKRASGYALAPTGNLVLKQVNKDGTMGNVCTD